MENLEELKTELQAPIKSFRIFAIEKILKSEPSIELLAIIKECQTTEKDSECLLLLGHAAEQLSEALSGKSARTLPLDDLEKAFDGATPENQLEMLRAIKVSSLKSCNPETLVPKLLKLCSSDVVAAEIVKKFRRFWPESLRSYLEKNVFSRSGCLQIASIESLMKIFPESLKTQLPRLINVNDPVVRSLAIFSMSRFFPELAADFIADCLENGDYYNKATALRICSTLDFSMVRNSLLKLLLVETDSRIFNAACIVIFNNPDREVPFRLMDMITKSGGEKARYLNDFLPRYCENLKISGICGDFSSYMQTLSNYAETLRARVLVHRCLQHLEADAPDKKSAAVAELEAAAEKNPAVAPILKEYLSKNSMAPAAEFLKKITGIASIASEEVARKEETSSESQQNDKEDEASLLKEFARARFKKNPETAVRACNIIKKTDATPALKLAAFKAATHLNVDGLLAYAKEFVEGKNEFEVSAGLDYLEKFDKDEFHRITQKLIHTDSIFVRNALVNSTSRSNPEYARFLIRTLLSHRDPQKRLHGLESTVQLEFSYIFQDLIKFLRAEENKELIQSCLSIILANPTIDSIFELRQIRKARTAIAELIEPAENELMKVLQEIGIAGSQEIGDFISKKEKEAAARLNTRDAARDLVEARKKMAWGSSPGKTGIASQYSLHIAGLITGVIIISFAFFWWRQPTKKTASPKPAASSPIKISKTRTRALEALPAAGMQKTLKLVSYDKGNRTWTVEDQEQKKYRVFIPKAQDYKANDRLLVTVDAARYSLTGQVVIFVKEAQLLK